MSSVVVVRFVVLGLCAAVPLVNGQVECLWPGPSTQVGVALVGTLNTSLTEKSPELCCYAANRAGGKAWTYQAHGGDTCDNQTHLEGIAFNDAGSGTHVVPGNSPDDCCGLAVASGHSLWTHDKSAKTCTLYYEVRGRRHDAASTSGMGMIPGTDTCDMQTILDGVAFDQTSGTTPVKTNSSEACCGVAKGQMRALWSFNKRTHDCTVFYELRGRHLDSDVTSGMGSTPGVGTCKIFSSVAGKTSDVRSMSAEITEAASKTVLL